MTTNKAQEAVKHLRNLAKNLGLQVWGNDNGFLVYVGPRKHPSWETIKVSRPSWGPDPRNPIYASDTIIEVNYEGYGATRPITPKKAIRLMQKAGKRADPRWVRQLPQESAQDQPSETEEAWLTDMKARRWVARTPDELGEDV